MYKTQDFVWHGTSAVPSRQAERLAGRSHVPAPTSRVPPHRLPSAHFCSCPVPSGGGSFPYLTVTKSLAGAKEGYFDPRWAITKEKRPLHRQSCPVPFPLPSICASFSPAAVPPPSLLSILCSPCAPRRCSRYAAAGSIEPCPRPTGPPRVFLLPIRAGASWPRCALLPLSTRPTSLPIPQRRLAVRRYG
jgi:hypothetical protein